MIRLDMCGYFHIFAFSVSPLPQPLQRAIEEFSKLPGIGHKSAERLTFHLLRSSKASPEALGNALLNLRIELHYCSECQMVTLQKKCSVCEDTYKHATQMDIFFGFYYI